MKLAPHSGQISAATRRSQIETGVGAFAVMVLMSTAICRAQAASDTNLSAEKEMPPWLKSYSEPLPQEEIRRKEHAQKTQALAEAGAQLYLAIVDKDIPAILRLLDDDGGVSSQARPMVYKDEVAEDLRSKKGHYYCLLFGCKKSRLPSIQSQLKKIPREQLAIDVEYLAEGDWAGVTFSRVLKRQPASKPQFYEGDYRRPLLTFRWKQGSWKVLTLFEK